MYLLGIDIGTSSTKSAIFDTDGRCITQASKEYVFDSEKPGFAEQDPEVWWDATVCSIKEAVQTGKIDIDQITAIGLSGQMHGLVALDENGKVLRNAILHCDVRAAKEAEEIKQISNGEIEKIAYNPVFPGFQGVSLYWMKKHEPEIYHKIYKVICPKDYVRYKMTGIIGTEHTDASGTLLYDMKESCWSSRIFKILDLNEELVPAHIAKSYEVAGRLTESAAAELGLTCKTVIAYGGADQAMHSTGNGIYKSGVEMATIGTSGQVLRISDSPVFNEELNTHTFRHVSDNTWYGLGAVLFAGSTLNWYRRVFCKNTSFETLSEEAEQIAPGSDGLVFFPCMGGERTPYMDPLAKGAFLGISVMHDKRHFARAIMEGVSFAMKCSIQKINELYGDADSLICAGGGVKGSVWAQIQADIYNQNIQVSSIKEQACLGAAIMAGIGCGSFDSLKDACEKMCDADMKTVAPEQQYVSAYERIYRDVYLKIYDANKEIFKTISEITE